MEDGEADNTSDEFEVVEMFGIDSGVGVDLESVIVVGWILKQAIEGIEHFVR